jgi:hypothetical protein
VLLSSSYFYIKGGKFSSSFFEVPFMFINAILYHCGLYIWNRLVFYIVDLKEVASCFQINSQMFATGDD